MSKFRIMLTFLLLVNLGCASERLYVKVVDGVGNPVTNGIVRVGVSTSHLLFGGGNSCTSKSGYAEGRTDTDGNAVVKFNGQSSDFGWYVEADGYYRSDIRQEHFKGEDVVIPPAFGYVILHEHEKKGKATIWRRINPQPMYSYSSRKSLRINPYIGRKSQSLLGLFRVTGTSRRFNASFRNPSNVILMTLKLS